MTVELTSELDERFNVDPFTGEIYDSEPSKVLDLALVARKLKELEDQFESVAEFRNDELSRIKESCEQRLKKILVHIRFFHAQADISMVAAQQTKAEYPGLGKFSYVKGREKVDTTLYDEADESKKKWIQAQRQGDFTVKTTIAPDKKRIKADLEKGDEFISQLFSIQKGDDTLTFKAE